MGTAAPQRIVSLTCSNTEILFALGLGSRLVGVDDWSDTPDEVTRLPRVGPDLKIDMAKVAALKPDLVLASLSVPGMESNLAGLERLGVPFMVLNPTTLDDVLKDIEVIGEATGAPEASRRLVALLQARIDAVRKRSGGAARRPTIYWEWWPKPLISPGRRSWIVQMTDLVAADLLFKEVDATSFVVEESQVFGRDPDYVMLCWCGTLERSMSAKRVTDRPAWKDLRAAQAGRIYCLPEALYGRPGPRLAEGLERLARIVHPELFA
jgi:iron complex transport system substrate-binding protein